VIVDHDPRGVICRLVRWADGRNSVRAMLLTSTRAHPSAPVNALSDYDVMLVVEDVRKFFEDRSWLMRNHPSITPPSRGHPARKVCPPRGLTLLYRGRS
jgi:hypothetical protein